MGGEDWQMWIEMLKDKNLLAEGFTTVSYSYLGPQITYAIYKEGTIGKAKEHLKQTADNMNAKLKDKHGNALVSVNKAVVTQASAAIPVVPLYIALLFKIMKKQNTHEGCIEQIYRLFKDFLYSKNPLALDDDGYIRIDDYEMDDEVQNEILKLWGNLTTENVHDLTDLPGYQNDFYRLFGFNVAGVDYNADVDPEVKIPSLSEQSS